MLFDQSPYQCRVEWGKRGAREAAARGDIVIIVDVLSFSSAVVSAAAFGAEIYPYPPHLDGQKYAESLGADYIFGRAEAAKLGKPTLSPVSFSEEHAGKKYVLISQNGAYCTWIGAKATASLQGHCSMHQPLLLRLIYCKNSLAPESRSFRAEKNGLMPGSMKMLSGQQ